MVTGKDRKQVKASLFNDKGSTCSMVTKQLVKTLGLESIKKTVVVQSFGHTDSIDTEFVVLELLKQDGTIALIRAYVMESITTMAEVQIPQEIREEFKVGTSWPKSRFSGEIDILLGIEELSIHPNRIEIVGNPRSMPTAGGREKQAY